MSPSTENDCPYSVETLAICGLLHDVCKANFYKTEMRNAKDEKGKWVKVPYYAVDDQLPYGHGEKSVYIISGFMRLTREEAMAIRWHMGGFDDSAKGGSFALSRAFGDFPLALHLHVADLQATYIDERDSEKRGGEKVEYYDQKSFGNEQRRVHGAGGLRGR